MITFDDVSKIYQTAHGPVHALDHIHFHIEPGRFIILKGPSGSGKTTLLLMIATMLRPTQGKVNVCDQEIYTLHARDKAKFREQNIGFVFQMFHLLPYLDVLDNVLFANCSPGANGQRDRAREILTNLGLAERLTHKPAELSAGEKQRTAIARAMLNQPRIILADEPTGNLDPDNARDVIEHLADFHRQGGTVVLASHQEIANPFADQIIHLQNGRQIDKTTTKT